MVLSRETSCLLFWVNEVGWLLRVFSLREPLSLPALHTEITQPCFLAFGSWREVSVSSPSADRKKCFARDLLILPFCRQCFNAQLPKETWDLIALATICIAKNEVPT